MKLFDVYPLFPIEIDHAKGCKVYDAEGTEYLDLYGGHAVISIGHSHPNYVKAISEQITKLGFYSNSVLNPLQVKLADKLGKISGYEDYSLFLANSGAEAIENALKLASFHNGRNKVLSFKGGFHGRTSAAVRITDIPKFIAPVNEGLDVTFIALNDIEAARKALSSQNYSSVVIEGIQGIGGIQVPDNQFLKELRALCTETKTVLILDEIQSGYGRSGKFFAHQYAGIKADIITMAKGICNGFPMSGIVISPEFTASYGQLGSTFGGNHLACAAAISVLEVIDQEELMSNATKIGNYLMEELKQLPIKEIRGRGLMIGMEFEKPIKEIRQKLLFDKKIFTGVTGTHVIRLLPPLCLNKQQADYFIESLKDCL